MQMTVNLILFLILALVAIASALGMLFSRNAVYAALYLILNFGTVAIFYLQLHAPFIAISQVTVYAGAIMVLFLFVIMLLGAERLPQSNRLDWQRPLALFLAVVLIGEAVYLALSNRVILPTAQSIPDTFGSPVSVGEMLFTRYLLPFEVTSVLLLIAMVGAIVLTRSEKSGRGDDR
jgi:NADH-quinone oxidoreductase subunit J